jgi:hypothetical protein
MYLQALDETGFDYDTLRKDKYIAGKIELCLRSHNLTPSHAREIAPLPPADKRFWAETLKNTPIPIRELKQQIIERKKAQLPTPLLPGGVYHVLYVDPPWDIEAFSRTTEEAAGLSGQLQPSGVELDQVETLPIKLNKMEIKLKNRVYLCPDVSNSHGPCATKVIFGLILF